ncbi:LysR substrate-binding domain-containing protein [Burkholderia gladioli]|uniref:LysR substrate-binding domain-containing protein n=1 Tax=Burkholderia gladioli TaxID=28095 RepID=UPI003D19F808
MLTSDTVVTRLMEMIPFELVSSPEYLTRAGTPTHPSQIADHMVVAFSTSIRKPEMRFRRRRGGAHGAVSLRDRVEQRAFNLGLVLKGFGLGMLPTSVVEEYLESGQLVSVLPDFRWSTWAPRSVWLTAPAPCCRPRCAASSSTRSASSKARTHRCRAEPARPGACSRQLIFHFHFAGCASAFPADA